MKNLLIATVLLASSSAALAQSAYIGGTVGAARSNVDCAGTSSCSKNSTAGKAFVGYQINNMFALEASYFDLGKVDATVGAAGINIKSTGYGLRGLIFVPFNKDFSGFAAVGVNRVKSKASVTVGAVAGSLDETSTKPSLALGVDYALTPALKLRGEFENVRFNAPANSGSYNVNTFSVGLKYSF
jgi:OOP family OmpA-OmpF porin